MHVEKFNNITGKFEVLKVVLKQNKDMVLSGCPTKVQYDLLMSYANDIVHTIKNMKIQEDQPPIDTRIQNLKDEVAAFNRQMLYKLEDLKQNTGS